MKKCKRCKQQLPLTAFGNDKTRDDGKYPYCIECQRAYHKARRKRCKANMTRICMTGEKRCTKCNNVKPVTCFSPASNGTTKDGRLGWCAECNAKNRRDYHAKNPIKYRTDAAIRRANKLKVTVEQVSYRKVYERDNGQCYLCHRFITLKEMHLEHKIPLSRGGEHSYANCGVSCRKCNLRKGAKLPHEVTHG